ncbi:MAG: hypothetical protein WA021_01330 [Minisyncoccia bacterium]
MNAFGAILGGDGEVFLQEHYQFFRQETPVCKVCAKGAVYAAAASLEVSLEGARVAIRELDALVRRKTNGCFDNVALFQDRRGIHKGQIVALLREARDVRA